MIGKQMAVETKTNRMDDLVTLQWMQAGFNRDNYRSLGKAYDQQWTSYNWYDDDDDDTFTTNGKQIRIKKASSGKFCSGPRTVPPATCTKRVEPQYLLFLQIIIR